MGSKLVDRVKKLERDIADLRNPRSYTSRGPRQRSNSEPVGAPMLLAKWIAENPNLTANELQEKLRREGRVGVKRGTVTAIRYHSRNVIRELQSLGRLPVGFMS